MKKLILFPVFLFFISFLNAQADIGSGLSDDIKEIKKASEVTSYKLVQDVNGMIKLVDDATSNAQKISKRLEKKFANGTMNNLTNREKELLYKEIKEIHSNYKLIDDNRKMLIGLLTGYNYDIEAQVIKARSLTKKYEDRHRDNTYKRDHLLRIIDRTESQESSLKSAELNIKLLNSILTFLNSVEDQVEQVKTKFMESHDKISNFFSTVKNGEETTEYLVTFFELQLEFDEISKQAEDLIKLESLTKDITESLNNLTNSVLKLNSINTVL